MKYLNNIKYILQHKWFVFRAGLVTGTPIWQLIVHDWSKFTRIEFKGYAEHFYGADRGTPNRPSSRQFVYAWVHHIHYNPHHWNYWAVVGSSGQIKAHKMPDRYIREMVADWVGAGRSITGNWMGILTWYKQEKNRMVLEVTTRDRVEQLMTEKIKPWLEKLCIE